jgi:hypothetical protein
MNRIFRAVLGTAWLLVAPEAARAAAPTVTSFTPGSGPLNTTVTITGTGFTGASSVQFDGTSSNFTVKSATQISALVPPTGTGPIAVTNAGATGTSTASFTVTPSLEFSPSIGHESIAVTVTGAGFAPYNAIDLYFDTTDVELAVSNSLGVVSIQFQVPATAQPGTHWITLLTRATGIAAQRAFTVNSDWAMQGVAPTGLGFNPYENTLFSTNVGQLAQAWSQPDGGFANPSPIVEVAGNLYTGSVLGQIYAYSATGTLLWSAAPAEASFQEYAPAANASLVFFGSGTTVYAYKLACSSTGAVCSPTWTATIGASVAGSLTVYNNTLYVPASNGDIYPLTPSTGAVGTPFAASGSSGTATSQVAFGLDGSYYYAEGSKLAYRTSSGASTVVSYSASLSGIAVSAGRVYFTTGNGMLIRWQSWSAATSGTGCTPAPVVAGHYVFAGGCSSISAFEAGSGELAWSVPTVGQVLGLSVANDVLYGCVLNGYYGELTAYDALYGALLWSGGTCTSAPIVANGNVYAALGNITAYTLPGLSANHVKAKPARFMLRPNLKLVAQHTPG